MNALPGHLAVVAAATSSEQACREAINNAREALKETCDECEGIGHTTLLDVEDEDDEDECDGCGGTGKVVPDDLEQTDAQLLQAVLGLSTLRAALSRLDTALAKAAGI